MEDSSTYQAILAKGEAKGEAKGKAKALQETLLRLGRKRFGPASKAIQTTIHEITEIHRLERLTERLLDVASWRDLLADT